MAPTPTRLTRSQLAAALGHPADPGPQQGQFELALALTGTASAGAYTAGVLDFLQLALDAWTQAQARGEDVPRHRVLLRGVAGASGGAVSAALFTAGLAKAQTGPTALYQGWVEGPQAVNMLKVPPAPVSPVTELLYSEFLDELTQAVLPGVAAAPDHPWRPWVADPFTMRHMLGNLTGVPYWLPMTGAANGTDGVRMLLYSDYAGYGVSPTSASPRPGDSPLPPLGTASLTSWEQTVFSSCVASSSVPVFFRTRTQDTTLAQRNARPFLSPLDGDSWVAIPPDWPAAFGPDYQSYNCDGGLCDGQPLDAAREILAGPGGSNERSPALAQRMVIMVAPLVEAPGIEAWKPRPLGSLGAAAAAVVGALFANAQFKTTDLVLGALEGVASRWIIAPKGPGRAPGAWAPPTPNIGYGFTWFGAMFHRAFRQHDYDLGRYDCQRFLAETFQLPATNPGFLEDGATGMRAIIPLVGEAAKPVPPPLYPQPGTFTAADLKDLATRAGARLDYLKACVAGPCAWWERLAIAGFWKAWARRKALDGFVGQVEAFLKAYRL